METSHPSKPISYIDLKQIRDLLQSLLTHQYQSIKESYAWLVGLHKEGERRKGRATAPSEIEQEKETFQ